MEHQSIHPEVTFHHEPASGDEFKKRIRKTTILLSVITLIELGLGLFMYATVGEFPHFVILLIKGTITILTLAKAFYIISIFMHLGDEIRNLIMSIAVPIMLFIWFITAFLWDGNSFKTLRNRYDASFKERTKVPVQGKAVPDTTTHLPGTKD